MRHDRDDGARAWRAGFVSLEHEVIEAVPLEVRGRLPAELRGTLYRVGPARLDVYGDRLRHWFDGDGMVHALRCGNGQIHYLNRFVASAAKRAEDRQRRRIYGGFGTRLAGSALTRFLHRSWRRNAGNTNVIALADRLLALCEVGRPHRLDATTLATLGEDALGGALAPGDAFSAHPKLDPATGELWNFGMAYGREPRLTLYRGSADGVFARVASIPLPQPAWVHDFALTARHAIIVVAPLVLPRAPIGIMLGQRSLADALRWRPELGCHIGVVERAGGAVRWYHTAPLLMVHAINAWDEDDAVVLHAANYDDGNMVRLAGEYMEGATRTIARAYPERLRLRGDGRVERRRLAEGTLELPRVADSARLREHRRVYGLAWCEQVELPAVPTAIDLRNGQTIRAPMRPYEFAGECVPVHKAGADTEDDVWLLTLVLDAAAGVTELRVLDGADLRAPPVATARLPHLVPFGFHGNWVPVP